MRIDRRLGHFQKTFQLTGNEVRKLAFRSPQLITFSINTIKVNTFTVKEEFGFDEFETKKLLLNKPKVWMISK